MWKQTLILSATVAACVPAGPQPTYYPPPQQYGQQPPPPPGPDQPPPPNPDYPPPNPVPPPPPQPDAWRFDARGWTLLGSATVDGHHDRDAIGVGKYAGKFDQLTMVVYDSDLQLDDVVITFGNGTSFSPNVKHVFRENQRSRNIDLPGNDRMIQRIDLRYSNIGGGGRARVEIYGRDTGQARPEPRPDPWKFDNRGWTLLGSESVDGRHDRDSIRVGKYSGRFDQLTMVVYDSDLQLDDVVVTFGNGESFAPSVKHVFTEGQRSRNIDLPGDDRVIRTIDLRYSNLPGGGKARIEIYGRDTGKARPTPPPDPWKFDNRGWSLLGSKAVDGRRDRDVIRVGKYSGRFDQLTMVVYDSDLQLDDFVITFGNGETFSPSIKHVFKENQRSRNIDLPGDDRMIKSIDLKYSNLPGGGKARIEIYGRDTGKARPDDPKPDPKPSDTFDATGWNVIGRTVVDGQRDRDVLQVNDGQQYKSIMLHVVDGDLELNDIVITFGNNDTYSPHTRLVFKEGSRSSSFDLPGTLRKIKSIELKYGNLSAGKAAVEVYGKAKGHR